MSLTMSTAKSYGALVLLVVLCQTAFTGCKDDEGHACTARGCAAEGATFTVSLQQTLETIRAATIEACFNDHCISGALTGISSQVALGVISRTEVTVALAPLAGAPGDYQLKIDYRSPWDDAFADGDRYHIKLVSLSGTVLLDQEQTVIYGVSYPNGEECPGVCRFISLILPSLSNAPSRTGSD